MLSNWVQGKCCQIRYLGQEFKADSMNPSNRLLKASNQRPEFLESYIRIFDSFDSSFIRKIRKIQLQLPALPRQTQEPCQDLGCQFLPQMLEVAVTREPRARVATDRAYG